MVTACKPTARYTQETNLLRTGAAYLQKDSSIDHLKVADGESKRALAAAHHHLEKPQYNRVETTSPPREELSDETD